MNKILVLFWGLILLISCDKDAYYDYYVINECNEEINIYIESDWKKFNDIISVVIPPYENRLMYHGEWINEVNDRMVERFFLKIIITKGNTISNVNYVNKNLWRFEPISKDHANSYLTVTMEDFEDKPSGGR